MSTEPHSVIDIVDGLEGLAERQVRVSVGDVLDEFGNRSFAPIMFIFALLDLTPVAGIPGVPSFLAFCIALVAVQLLLAREHIWVPGFIERRSISGAKLEKARTGLTKVAHFLDGLTTSRLKPLTHGSALQIYAGLIIVLCLTVPPLEFIPFASVAPMLTIAVICLSLITRDGFAIMMASIFSVSTLGYGTWLIWSGEASQMAADASARLAAVGLQPIGLI